MSSNTTVAKLAWKLECSLSGDRLDFEVNIGFLCVQSYGHHRERHAGGRARVTMVTRRRAGVEVSVLPEIPKSPCWLGNSNDHVAVTDWISKEGVGRLYVPQPPWRIPGETPLAFFEPTHPAAGAPRGEKCHHIF